MSKTRFILLGGFLGAGKTTAIARLAAMYRDRGLRVGIVTNDQAPDLVDTHQLRARGFAVGEVAGACFCCNFNELVRVVGSLSREAPDVVLAEPVGSCTDIAATVIQPLLGLHGERFEVAPYGVLLKPGQGRAVLESRGPRGFSTSTSYIFQKQLEEADVILINRVDELPPAEIEALSVLIETRHPQVPVLRVSARTGEGFDALLEFLDQRGEFGRRFLDLDYDVYAEGEAELGWLNSSLVVFGSGLFALDDLLLDVVSRVRDELVDAGAEAAHVKAIGLQEGYSGVANLISSALEPELSVPSGGRVREASLIVNARVAMDPEPLETRVRGALAKACSAHRARPDFLRTRSFRPGRPVPTHRYRG
jgi:Ni2+-binding GTPase involved in maturation of urease and hydrogenase